MRRTAALLSLPLYFTAPWVLETWLRLQTAVQPAFPLPLSLILPPGLLLLAACFGREQTFRQGLQIIGHLWTLAVWARLSLQMDDLFLEVLNGTLFLGLTTLSMAEAVFFARRPPTPDPERRLTLALLILLSTAAPTRLAYYIHTTAFEWSLLTLSSVLKYWIFPLRTSIGLGCVLLLAAWGVVRGRRWTMWVAIAAAAVTVVSGIIQSVTGRTYLRFYYYLGEAFPEHLLLATVAILLVRRLRRLRQEPAPAR